MKSFPLPDSSDTHQDQDPMPAFLNRKCQVLKMEVSCSPDCLLAADQHSMYGFYGKRH